MIGGISVDSGDEHTDGIDRIIGKAFAKEPAFEMFFPADKEANDVDLIGTKGVAGEGRPFGVEAGIDTVEEFLSAAGFGFEPANWVGDVDVEAEVFQVGLGGIFQAQYVSALGG